VKVPKAHHPKRAAEIFLAPGEVIHRWLRRTNPLRFLASHE
jgi:hypothetical protein